MLIYRTISIVQVSLGSAQARRLVAGLPPGRQVCTQALGMLPVLLDERLLPDSSVCRFYLMIWGPQKDPSQSRKFNIHIALCSMHCMYSVASSAGASTGAMGARSGGLPGCTPGVQGF